MPLNTSSKELIEFIAHLPHAPKKVVDHQISSKIQSVHWTKKLLDELIDDVTHKNLLPEIQTLLGSPTPVFLSGKITQEDMINLSRYESNRHKANFIYLRYVHFLCSVVCFLGEQQILMPGMPIKINHKTMFEEKCLSDGSDKDKSLGFARLIHDLHLSHRGQLVHYSKALRHGFLINISQQTNQKAFIEHMQEVRGLHLEHINFLYNRADEIGADLSDETQIREIIRILVEVSHIDSLMRLLIGDNEYNHDANKKFVQESIKKTLKLKSNEALTKKIKKSGFKKKNKKARRERTKLKDGYFNNLIEKEYAASCDEAQKTALGHYQNSGSNLIYQSVKDNFKQRLGFDPSKENTNIGELLRSTKLEEGFDPQAYLALIQDGQSTLHKINLEIKRLHDQPSLGPNRIIDIEYLRQLASALEPIFVLYKSKSFNELGCPSNLTITDYDVFLNNHMVECCMLYQYMFEWSIVAFKLCLPHHQTLLKKILASLGNNLLNHFKVNYATASMQNRATLNLTEEQRKSIEGIELFDELSQYMMSFLPGKKAPQVSILLQDVSLAKLKEETLEYASEMDKNIQTYRHLCESNSKKACRLIDDPEYLTHKSKTVDLFKEVFFQIALLQHTDSYQKIISSLNPANKNTTLLSENEKPDKLQEILDTLKLLTQTCKKANELLNSLPDVPTYQICQNLLRDIQRGYERAVISVRVAMSKNQNRERFESIVEQLKTLTIEDQPKPENHTPKEEVDNQIREVPAADACQALPYLDAIKKALTKYDASIELAVPLNLKPKAVIKVETTLALLERQSGQLYNKCMSPTFNPEEVQSLVEKCLNLLSYKPTSLSDQHSIRMYAYTWCFSTALNLAMTHISKHVKTTPPNLALVKTHLNRIYEALVYSLASNKKFEAKGLALLRKLEWLPEQKEETIIKKAKSGPDQTIAPISCDLRLSEDYVTALPLEHKWVDMIFLPNNLFPNYKDDVNKLIGQIKTMDASWINKSHQYMTKRIQELKTHLIASDVELSTEQTIRHHLAIIRIHHYFFLSIHRHADKALTQPYLTYSLDDLFTHHGFLFAILNTAQTLETDFFQAMLTCLEESMDHLSQSLASSELKRTDTAQLPVLLETIIKNLQSLLPHPSLDSLKERTNVVILKSMAVKDELNQFVHQTKEKESTSVHTDNEEPSKRFDKGKASKHAYSSLNEASNSSEHLESTEKSNDNTTAIEGSQPMVSSEEGKKDSDKSTTIIIPSVEQRLSRICEQSDKLQDRLKHALVIQAEQEAKLRQMMSASSKKDKKLIDLQNEVKRLEHKHKSTAELLSKSKDRLTSQQSVITEQRIEIKRFRKKLESQSESNEYSESEIKRLEERLKRSQEFIAKLKKQIKALNEKQATFVNQSADNNDQRSRLQEQIYIKEKANGKLKKQINRKDQIIKDKDIKLNDAKDQHTNLIAKNASQQFAHRVKVKKLTQEITIRDETISQLTGKLASLNKKLEEQTPNIQSQNKSEKQESQADHAPEVLSDPMAHYTKVEPQITPAIPVPALTLIKHIKTLGYRADIFGGFIRDHVKPKMMHGRYYAQFKDVDIVTDLPLEILNDENLTGDKKAAAEYIKQHYKHETRVTGVHLRKAFFKGLNIDLVLKPGLDVANYYKQLDCNVNAMLMDDTWTMWAPTEYKESIDNNELRIIPLPEFAGLPYYEAACKTLKTDPIRIFRVLNLLGRFKGSVELEKILNDAAPFVFKLPPNLYMAQMLNFINHQNFEHWLHNHPDLVSKLSAGLVPAKDSEQFETFKHYFQCHRSYYGYNMTLENYFGFLLAFERKFAKAIKMNEADYVTTHLQHVLLKAIVCKDSDVKDVSVDFSQYKPFNALTMDEYRKIKEAFEHSPSESNQPAITTGFDAMRAQQGKLKAKTQMTESVASPVLRPPSS